MAKNLKKKKNLKSLSAASTVSFDHHLVVVDFSELLGLVKNKSFEFSRLKS